MEPKEKAALVLQKLKKLYPRVKTALNYSSPWQLLAATILSAQCTDKRVNIVTKTLFAKSPGIDDFASLSQMELEKEIRSTGFYRAKAKNILATAKKIKQEFGGMVPRTMEELVTLHGVGRKTANIVLSAGFGKNEGMAVDTHVKRLSYRIGLTRHTDPVKIEKDLTALIPRRDWDKFSLLLIQHGREVCTARRPNCAACVLNKVCDSAFRV
ncbi:MAG: endonuclease III [Candidatus Diapherotrites archaeon]|nr:endonuclease III [Candidatus Diapherotrites archaeon]